jgi:hypothetical protein
MRKVSYGGAISLDGFLAGPGEAIDWLRWSEDAAQIAAASFKGVDAMLMGRRTFEFAQKMGGGPPLKASPATSSRGPSSDCRTARPASWCAGTRPSSCGG